MLSKFSYFILVGIIIYTNGNPAYRQDSYNDKPQYDLKTLIEELSKQGKYDVMLMNHEDRPGNHHEDITKITYNGDNANNHFYNDQYLNAELYQGVRGKNSNYNNQPSTQNLNLFLRNKLDTLKSKENNDETKDCMKKWGTCTELVWNFTDTKTPTTRSNMGHGQEDDDDNTETRNYSENDDEVYLKPKNVLKFLNVLDKTLKLDRKNDIELRCYGNGCGVNRVDDNRNGDSDNRDDYNIINENYVRALRCNGKRCSIDKDDDDRNYRDNLRCYGNRCSRKTNDRDDDNDVNNNEDGFYKDINHILRSNRDDSDRNSIDSFRCIGDRCSRNRDDDDRRDTLRCIGDRCSRNRGNDRVDNDNDRYVDGDNIYDDRDNRYDDRGNSYNDRYDDRDNRYNDRDGLLCVGDRCGRNGDNDETDNLYCTGNRCSRNRNDDNGNSISTFRCIGELCSRDRDDRGDRYDGKDDRSRLRCVGDRCGGNRDDNERSVYGRSRLDEGELELKLKGKKNSKTYKVDKDLVAELDKIFAVELKKKQSIEEKNKKRNIKRFKKNQATLRHLVLQIIEAYLKGRQSLPDEFHEIIKNWRHLDPS